MTRPPLDLHRVLPELELIRDKGLREKVTAVWLDVWQESAFEDIADVPIGPGIPYPHVPHNRAVVTMALSVAETLERFHGIEVDRDVLLAAALVQDVSKLVELAPAGDGVEPTKLGRSFQHAFWAAHKALEHGLPMEVCEIVLNHTPDAPGLPRTLEGKIIWHVDQLDVTAVFGDRWVKHLFLTR